MKILRLNFKNINSLKGEHTVDFTADNFTRNPLFAITGPTGSGKTTVLDVISLALFNQVPRLGKISKKIIKEKGAILTRNQKEAHAEVRYQCPEGIFTAIWSIGTARTGNLQDYEMELYRNAPVEALDLKKSEIPAKNATLIGLDYQQFIKSVLLAQGEFSKFLKSDVKNRSLLLEQITGTSIYRELGRNAYRKYKEAYKKIADQEHILEAEKEKILTEEARGKLEKEREEINEKATNYTAELEEVKTQLRLKKEFDELHNTLSERNESLARTLKKEESFLEQYGEKIDDHETVQNFTKALENWKYKRHSVVELRAEKNKLSQIEEEQVTKQVILLKEIEKFVAEKVTKNQVESKLHRFYEKTAGLQKKRENLLAEYRQKEELFGLKTKDLTLKINAKALLKDPASWQQIQQRCKNERQKIDQSLHKTLENAEEEIIKAEERLTLLRSAQNEERYIGKLREQVTHLEEEFKTLREELKHLPRNIKEKEKRVRIYDLTLEKSQLEQEKNKMQVSLEDLREKLRAGQPCPLCGAKEHPYSTHLPPVKSGLEQKITHEKEQLRRVEQELTVLKTKKETREEQETKQKKELDNRQTELDQLVIEFNNTYGDRFDLEENKWTSKIENQKEELQLLKEVVILQQQEQCIAEAQPVYTAAQSIKKEGIILTKKLDKLYRGADIQKDVRQLENQWLELVQNITTTREWFKEIDDKLRKEEEGVERIEKELLPQLEEQGFASIQAAESALLDSYKYKTLKEKKQQYRDIINTLRTEIETREKHRASLNTQLNTDKTAASLKVTQESFEKELEICKEKQSENRRLLKNDEERQMQIGRLKYKISDQQQENRPWEMLNHLIGSAQGDAFNDFAQHLTLKYLLKLANRRLRQINQRYRLNMDTETHNNLVVADLDMGGEERSVNTLSGGESFLISLGLALALSDLASRNININSLFIDEGFGTLDQETLDQTLDTLEQLQASTVKTIGIISHVESLKERIGLQIQLTKNGRGFSSLAVVSV